MARNNRINSVIPIKMVFKKVKKAFEKYRKRVLKEVCDYLKFVKKYWRKKFHYPQLAAWCHSWGIITSLSLMLLLIVGSALFFRPLGNRQITNVLTRPLNPQPHLQLAEVYLNNNQLEKAHRQLLLAQKQMAKSNLTEQILQLVLKIHKPEKIRREIDYWQEIVKEKPDYRDAYLKLAVLNWQVYENEKARLFLQKALDLDPNYELGRKVEEIIQ